MTKKTAKAILHVYNNDIVGKLDGNEVAKNKMITLLNNVVQISYQRSISAAQMYQNMCEAFEYIEEYLKEQCKGTNYVFSYSTDSDNQIVRCRYGLAEDNLPFSCDSIKTFKKMKGE